MKPRSGMWLDATLGALVLVTSGVFAWTPLPIEDDPLLRMPGTQPGDEVVLEAPNRCLNCHGGYDPAIEPGFNWTGSMMAQAARDPIFWATLVVAAQDSIWALGNPNAADLCERCHFPAGWLGGRSDPANASTMTGSDFDGVHCDFCHRSWDPFFADLHAGVREGDDWIGLWDEAGNTGPGSGTPSQDGADQTLLADRALAAETQNFDGSPFHVDDRPVSPKWLEQASGQFFVSPDTEKRASFADAPGRHAILYSRFHKSRYFCGTCHDVSNPVLANLGLSGLVDDGSGTLITEQYSAHAYFHVERTFSEFMVSAYGAPGGAATNPGFQSQGGSTITHAARCQDCHLPDGVGKAADMNNAVLRPTDSNEHPASGLPVHDMTGGNAWMSWILASLDPSGPVHDPVNVALLDQGASVLTLDLDAGQSPRNSGAALKAGSDRALAQLQMAATLDNLDYDPVSGEFAFRIINNTGHKLPTGYPEGRRMFVNVRVLDANGGLIQEINPYDDTVGTLKGLGESPTLDPGERHLDALVYEIHPSSTLTGELHTSHFVLADGRSKDNRIPPKGFDPQAAAARLALPVDPVTHLEDADYFSDEEYAGGFDDVVVDLVPGASSVQVSVYYQGTSREYIQFLRDEINGDATSLSSPTPSGEEQAYVVQTDPFFDALRAWGQVIWALWWHNHGLDGSATAVPGIVPALMIQASIGGASTLHVEGERYVTDVDAELLASVADNDWDSDDRPLSFSLLAGPAEGALAFSADGSFQYLPPAGVRNIEEQFVYRVDNGQETADASAHILVGIVILETGFEDDEE